MKRAAFLRGAAAFAVAAPAIVRAQGAWPDKQIRMVIPFAAGGTTDLLARALGQHMTQAWGQPVVADNRAGANGVVAGEIVAKSAGDGYTLSMVAMGHAINPLLYKKLPYDGTADFTPISLVATFPQLVLVHPAVKAGTHRRAHRAGEDGVAAAHLCLGRQRLLAASGGRAVRAHGRDQDDPRRLQGRQPRAARPDGGQRRHDDHPAQLQGPHHLAARCARLP